MKQVYMERTLVNTEKNLQEVIDSFWAAVPPAWNRIKSNIRSIAVMDHNISVEQFHILRNIRRGITSVSELAEVKQISRPAISQAVDLLVERGLICRLQNAKDRRNIPLDLTPAGNKLIDAIWERNRTWMKTRMASLSGQELATLSAAFEILSRTFAE
jgi:DNA-binding MarR family transcriptional regulator